MKIKNCKSCCTDFVPVRPLQRVCSPACAIAIVKVKQAQRAAKQQRQDKKRIKTKGKWLQEAQVEFNKYIRMRDQLVTWPCISCQKQPKKANAGHYKSTKAYPESRFDEDNCHLQCEHCNTYLSGNISAYRVNLISRIGLERVERLEGKHEAKHYTIEEIKEIKIKYRNLSRLFIANL